MKKQGELLKILGKICYEGTKFPKRLYEDGIHDTVMWALGEITDKEFEKILVGKE